MPTDCKHRSKANDDGNGLANEHIDTAGDGILDSTHVSRHTGNDVALALLGEETQGELQHFLVNLNTNVANHTRSKGNHDC